MYPLRLLLGLSVLWLCGARMAAQPLYFSDSSATLSLNTLNAIATDGTGKTTPFTASGPGVNNVSRCTAMAVDALNHKFFFVDASANSLWSVNLDGTDLQLVRSGLTGYPSDLALDVLQERIYYTTTSTIQTNNTVQRMDYTGNNNTLLFTAPGGTGTSRCTALAVDLAHSVIFVADAGAQKIWSLGLTGGTATAIAAIGSGYPTDVALDTTNQQVYFTVGSATQVANLVLKVGYNGSGLAAVFPGGGNVQRCTALDLDAAHGIIYLSDAGANSIWSIPAGGGSTALVTASLPATARRVRWFSGPLERPGPGFVSLRLSGTNAIFSATNGYLGGTYYVLTSTNLAVPLSQWLPVCTNVLAAGGSFTLTATNAAAARSPRQFYVLRVQ